MAGLARTLLDRWNLGFSRLRGTHHSPADEQATVQNCWSWSLSRWLQTKKGALVIEFSPRERILRCQWAPEGDAGPLWHFEPTHPRRGLKGIWHSFIHEGKPKDMRCAKS